MSQLILKYQQKLGETEFDVDLTLPSQGITAIFGRSGAGKTSLINAISGLKNPDSGQIEVSGITLFDSSKGVNLPVPPAQSGLCVSRISSVSTYESVEQLKIWR